MNDRRDASRERGAVQAQPKGDWPLRAAWGGQGREGSWRPQPATQGPIACFARTARGLDLGYSHAVGRQTRREGC